VQHVGNDAFDALDLAGRVVAKMRAEDERGTERGVQPGPGGAGETRVFSFEHFPCSSCDGKQAGPPVLQPRSRSESLWLWQHWQAAQPVALALLQLASHGELS
jgi:hypothetical protein